MHETVCMRVQVEREAGAGLWDASTQLLLRELAAFAAQEGQGGGGRRGGRSSA